jgi:hypothetical protein
MTNRKQAVVSINRCGIHLFSQDADAGGEVIKERTDKDPLDPDIWDHGRYL